MGEMQEEALTGRTADVPQVRNFLHAATGPGQSSEWAPAQVGLLQPSVCLSVCLHDLQLVCVTTDQ